MSKLKQTKIVFERGDLSKIAKESGFSESTVFKWYSGELKVKPETEAKILEASVRVAAAKGKELKGWLRFAKTIEAKAAEVANRLEKVITSL